MRKLSSLFLIGSLSLLSTAAYAGLEAPVVGGKPSPAGKWPEVALVVMPGALCSGTLVAPDVVLTAGHCVDDGPFEVVVGTTDYSKAGGEKIDVKQAIAYPDWQHTYDVGVLVLAHPAQAKPRAIAAACQVRDDLTNGADVHLVGFGLTTESGTGDNSKLNEVDLAVTDSSCSQEPDCNAKVKPGGEFVAGGNGTDSCFGDSGGPLYVDAAKNPALVGVVSRGGGPDGHPCGGGGIYVRADKVVSWIEKVSGRTLARAACDPKGDTDGPSEADGMAGGGGCSAGGGLAGGGLLLLVAGALWTLTITRRR